MKIISLICLAILFLIIGILLVKLVYKKDNSSKDHLATLLVGIGIIFNTVNENIIKAYDLISSYHFDHDFVRVFKIGNEDLGYSQELTKLVIVNLVIAVIWFYFNHFISKLISNRFFGKHENKVFITIVIFLSLVISLNPLFRGILDASYQIINQPFYN